MRQRPTVLQLPAPAALSRLFMVSSGQVLMCSVGGRPAARGVSALLVVRQFDFRISGALDHYAPNRHDTGSTTARSVDEVALLRDTISQYAPVLIAPLSKVRRAGVSGIFLVTAPRQRGNPEKSLVATIRSPFPREGEPTFRYAPLSSGLDIVRKSLGRHEIATIQTTAIDKDAGLLRLTTVLAHSSGEWISSEWPVCQITDIASAQRMGAALTYSRRYALFTLVGIAGEDDLDAPDLDAGHKPAMELARSDPCNPSNGQRGVAKRPPCGLEMASLASAEAVLTPGQSVILRERLLKELLAIGSADEAAVSAQRNLPAKNALTAGDAKVVEERFQAKLSTISDGHSGMTSAGTSEGLAPDRPPHAVLAASGRAEADTKQRDSMRAQKRSRTGVAHVLGKTVRLRDKDHRKFGLRQPCLVCGRLPSDPHHLRFAQPRGLGYRVSDEFTVPVCRIHHRELHRSGDEAAWWQKLNIDPLPVALRLWQHTHSEFAQISEGITPTQAAKIPDISAQTPLDPYTNVERPVPKDGEPNATE
jgi:ERF superfamily